MERLFIKEFAGLVVSDFQIFNYCKNYNSLFESIKLLRQKFNFHRNVYVFFFDTPEEVNIKLNVSIPKWSLALTEGYNIFIINASNWEINSFTKLREGIIHEFVHVQINHICKNRCPLWLNEGLAQYYSKEYKRTLNFKIDNEELDVYNLNYENTKLYTISAKLINYLIVNFGENLLLNKINSIKDFENDDLLGKKILMQYIKN